MADEWWKSAPVVQQPRQQQPGPSQSQGNWWEQAPVVTESTPAPRQPSGGADLALPGTELNLDTGPNRNDLAYWLNGGVSPEQEQSGEWRRGTLAPVMRNEQTGELRPAVPRIGMEAARAFSLPGEVARGEIDPMSPEGVDRGASLASFVTPGRLAPGAMRAMAQNGEQVPNEVIRALYRDGFSPQQAAGEVRGLGPGGMVADVGPSTQSLATGIARTPGESQTELVNALRGRSDTARTRIQSQVDDIAGPSISRRDMDQNLAAARQQTSPMYEEAFANASAVNPRMVADEIDSRIPNQRGQAQSYLRSIRGMLNVEGTNEIDPSPRTLHAVREELDRMLNAPDTGRGTKNQLRPIRSMIDDELAANVPGIKEADAAYQDIARRTEAFEEGRRVLRSGDNAVDPRDLRSLVDEYVQPTGVTQGPSGAAYALSQGARNELDRLIGTSSANRTGLRSAIQGDGSWNREKLSTLFGDERADRIIRLFDNEARMADTERQAIGGSVTATAEAAKQDLQPPQRNFPILEGPTIVNAGNLARRAMEGIRGPRVDNRIDQRNAAIARALVGAGDWNTAPTRGAQLAPAQLAVLQQLLQGSDFGEAAGHIGSGAMAPFR